MPEYSAYQQKVIHRYYENLDAISLQKLSELVADLYLSEGKKRQKLWERARAAMANARVPASRIDAIIESDSPEALAKLVSELSGKA